MPNSIGAPRTSKSPRSESPRLSADVIAREQLTPSDGEDMYRLLETYFQNTSVQQFAHDLAEKDVVILLRNPEDARVVGFSTLMTIGITMYSTTDVISVPHGIVMAEMPSSSATIGANAKIMIVSFRAT